MNCGPCVHKSAVAKYHNVSGFSVLPSMDPCHKALYHYIADGRTEENVWYRPLNQPDARPNIAEYIEELELDVLEQVKIKVIDNLDKDKVKKSAKSMIKNFDRGVKGNMQTFSKTLFSVGKEVTAPAKSGAKRKNRGLIPVQQTAKTRRVWKHRGSQPATGGRKVKDLEIRTQVLADFDGVDDAVYHSLPKQKKQQPKQVHSLNSSVQANRAGTKKH